MSFEFDPANGFRDASTYPDPANEAAAREQLMSLHDQTRDYINTLAASVTALQGDVQAIAGATGDPDAMDQILEELSDVKTYYFTDTITGTTPSVVVFPNGWRKTYEYDMITDATKAEIEFPNGDYVGRIKWETSAEGVLTLWFSTKPDNIVIRVTLIGLFQTGV